MSEIEITSMSSSSSLRRRVEELSPLPRSSFVIHRVPRQLAEVNSKAYEPQQVSIGPYHYGEAKLKRGEEVKLRYFKSLLERKPEIEAEEYVAAIEGRISTEALHCYGDEVNMPLHEFTEMLVIDDCFLIEVMTEKEAYLRAFPGRSSRRILIRDLILLENQIPWFVVCKLYDLVEGEGKHSALMKGLLDFCNGLFPGELASRETRSEEIEHFLGLIHFNWCPPTLPTALSSKPDVGVVIPSASELNNANVTFLRNNKYTSLFDVKFENGNLSIPTLVINVNTECVFRNQIAYEQLSPNDTPTPVSDYALLLDCLINTAKDVRILCGQNVIKNMLGSDEAVVKFVKHLTDGVMLKGHFEYAEIFKRINRHHQRPWNKAVASFHRRYFLNPWAYIAVLGALVLILQTIFSALKVFNK